MVRKDVRNIEGVGTLGQWENWDVVQQLEIRSEKGSPEQTARELRTWQSTPSWAVSKGDKGVHVMNLATAVVSERKCFQLRLV